MHERTWLSEFFSEDGHRSARLYVSTFGHEVEFFENDKSIRLVRMFEQTRQYAEDACDNWVRGIIKQ